MSRMRVLLFFAFPDTIDTIGRMTASVPEGFRSDMDLEAATVIDNSHHGASPAPDAALPFHILRDPSGLGEGRVMKIGLHFAVRKKFDIAIIITTRAPSALSALPDIIAPLVSGLAESVAGWNSRAVGLLTGLQNSVLGFPSRQAFAPVSAFLTSALSQIPYQRNSDHAVFEVQLAIQYRRKGLRCVDVAIPASCIRVPCAEPMTVLAWDTLRVCLLSRLHQFSIFYQREFDVSPGMHYYAPKLGYASSHTMAINAVKPGSRVLDLGCNEGEVANELKKKGCFVAGVDLFQVHNMHHFDHFTKANLNTFAVLPLPGPFDYVLLLDVIEHLDSPEDFLDAVRDLTADFNPTVIITIPNVAFAVTRFQLLLASFNYGKQGILDLTHKRLFTQGSVAKTLRQSGYRIRAVRGIPAPFPKVVGAGIVGRLLLLVNQMLILMSRSLFAYQIYLEAQPIPGLDIVLKRSMEPSPADQGTRP